MHITKSVFADPRRTGAVDIAIRSNVAGIDGLAAENSVPVWKAIQRLIQDNDGSIPAKGKPREK